MLLGREREQAVLEAALASARGGESVVLAIVGEAGIGKSSLLDFAGESAQGMRVLRARAVAAEAQIPFAGLFELLRPVLGLLETIPARQALALESALALRPATPEDRFAVGAATLSLLAASAEEAPLAVLVDDVQWLDGSTADALLFAVRRLLAEPIAVVLSARTGEPSLLDGAGLRTIEVAGLDVDAAAALLGGASADVAARLHRETGGNPLALVELRRHGLPQLVPTAPVPVLTSVSEAYAARAAALPERGRLAVLLGSATDRGDLALLARAGSLLGVDVADLDAAAEAGLVSVAGGSLEFTHPLARSAVYAGAPPDARRAVHRALADALPDADADRRAWHLALAAAGPDDSAAAALAQAADRAQARSAYDVASQAYERAAQLAVADSWRAGLLHAAADAAWLAGLADRASSLLASAARLAAQPELELQIEHLRGRIALRRGPLREGCAILAEAAERAAPAEAAVMLAEALMGAFYSADTEAARVYGARATALGERSTDPQTRFFGGIAGGMSLVLAEPGGRGAAAIRDAVGILEQSDELQADPRLLVWASMGPLWLREEATGLSLVDRATAAARERAAVGVLPHLLVHVAIQHATTDRWTEAQALFDETIRLARETGQRVDLTSALARLAWLEARLGRETASRAHAAEALELAAELGAALCEIWTRTALAELELVLGNVDAALVHLEVQRELVDRRGIADADLVPGPEQVEVYLRLGRAGDAAAAAGAFTAAATAKGQPWALARAARARGLLAPEEAFEPLFDEALELHERTPDVFERARTALAYGARLRRAGRRVQARGQLRAAFEGFDRLGAAPWAELARLELAGTGETARRRDPASLDDLTPQELQVSLLLAEGRTTREAAAALFLSPKTIEYHLRNVYRKLGVHSRDELRAALPTSPTPAAAAGRSST